MHEDIRQLCSEARRLLFFIYARQLGFQKRKSLQTIILPFSFSFFHFLFSFFILSVTYIFFDFNVETANLRMCWAPPDIVTGKTNYGYSRTAYNDNTTAAATTTTTNNDNNTNNSKQHNNDKHNNNDDNDNNNNADDNDHNDLNVSHALNEVPAFRNV